MSTLSLIIAFAFAALSLLAIFLINFYRDPEIKIPAGRNIVSPADGKIISLLTAAKGKETVKKGLLGKIEALTHDIAEECFILSVFMSPFDVHINRSPIDGKVLSVKHTPGKYFAAFNLEKSLMNEKNEITIENRQIGKIKVIQIAGFLARRIVCSVNKGDTVSKGQKIGKILLGSQVTIILPSNKIRLAVKKGQKVAAGKTILAHF